jgi:hypothetical protein
MIIKIKRKNVIEEVDNSQQILQLQAKIKSLELDLKNARETLPKKIDLLKQELIGLQNNPQETTEI